jgi:hypothetical protein
MANRQVASSAALRLGVRICDRPHGWRRGLQILRRSAADFMLYRAEIVGLVKAHRSDVCQSPLSNPDSYWRRFQTSAKPS